MNLVPFSVKPSCPKCGSKMTSTHYCVRSMPSNHCWDTMAHRLVSEEHLCKTCQNCSHFWFTELWDGTEIIEEESDGYES